jgi:hypothetical protein
MTCPVVAEISSLGQKRDALPGHFRQGLPEAIVGQKAIGRFRAGEGIIQSIPGDYFAELAAIAQDPALGVQDGSGPENL